jgi:hypothetical protein
VRNEETACLARKPASLTRVLWEMLSSTHIQPLHAVNHPSHPAAQNPFLATGGQRNLFGTAHGTTLPFCGSGPGALGMGHGTNLAEGAAVPSLQNRSTAGCHQDLLSYALPHHLNTVEGQAMYLTQVQAWHAANPNRKPDEQHHYSLTPGTPTIGSCECWGCRQTGHMQGAAVCAGAVLPEPEQDWQCIAVFIAHAFNTERLAASNTGNFIGVQQYTLYPAYHQQSYLRAYVKDVEDEQGNGQGLSE